MSRSEEIKCRLEASFAPQFIEVIDESEQHRGHAGFQEGGESHFRVRLCAASFAGQSRIARHRAVHAALGRELMTSIHALALELDIPENT
ncbi:MAG: BolA family protein [Paracoccaceae bacterium]